MTSPSSSPRRLLRSLSALLAVVATALGLGLAAAPTAHAATNDYVALGDSFSSGVGSRDYYADGTECLRSPKSYGALVAGRAGLDLTLAACSGATTADVIRDQIARLSSGTAYVSISIGGNDVGFADVLTECAKPGWASDCDGAIDDGVAVLRGPLPARIDDVLARIDARSPSARVVLVGYPHLFMGEDCNALTFFSPAEQTRLNAATDELNLMLRRRAQAAGAAFVDPRSAFTGHAVCDDPEWINGLSNPISESYHPNVAGHAAYADLVAPALVGSGAAVTTSRAASRATSRATATDVKLPRARAAGGPFRFTPPSADLVRAGER